MASWMRCLAPCAVGALMLCLTGCALGPVALERNRLKYNEAVRQTWNEQFLLNIVRLRYRDPPQFDAVTNILSQHEFGAATNNQEQLRSNETIIPKGMLNNNLFAQYLFGVNANIVERPTITIAPLEGADFTQHLLGPIHLETLVLLLSTGWDVDRVLRVAVHEMNGVENVKRVVGDLEQPPHPEAFVAMARQLAALQHQGLLEFAYQEYDKPVSQPTITSGNNNIKAADLMTAADKKYEYHVAALPGEKDKESKEEVVLFAKEQHPVMRVAPPAWGQGCGAEEVAHLLHLDPNQPFGTYKMLQGDALGQLKPPPQPGGDLLVSTRSLIGVLQFASKSIQVPQKHVEEGLVRDNHDGSNEVYDWSNALGGLIRVKSQKVRPAHAFVATKYRGYWFFIDDDDLTSKSTFALILGLYGIELAGGIAPGPIVTVPVGGGVSVTPPSGGRGGGGSRGG
jgi:hypothetical protein